MASVLIIDDEVQFLEMLKKFLEKEGYSVTTANDGRVGMELMSENKYDVIITDIVMPESDGLEVLMSQLKLQERPKIVAISGGSALLKQDMLLQTADILKADKVFSKPINLQQFAEALRELCYVP